MSTYAPNYDAHRKRSESCAQLVDALPIKKYMWCRYVLSLDGLGHLTAVARISHSKAVNSLKESSTSTVHLTA